MAKDKDDDGKVISLQKRGKDARRRGRGRPFEKGKPRPANAGRRKGTPNKATTEIRQFCRSLLEDPVYQANLRKKLRALRLHPSVHVIIHHYAYGKPKETIKHEGDVPVVTTHIYLPEKKS